MTQGNLTRNRTKRLKPASGNGFQGWGSGTSVFMRVSRGHALGSLASGRSRNVQNCTKSKGTPKRRVWQKCHCSHLIAILRKMPCSRKSSRLSLWLLLLQLLMLAVVRIARQRMKKMQGLAEGMLPAYSAPWRPIKIAILVASKSGFLFTAT